MCRVISGGQEAQCRSAPAATRNGIRAGGGDAKLADSGPTIDLRRLEALLAEQRKDDDKTKKEKN
jgi:hypothetical protein